ncbi:hypothetical protein [Mesorhizobium sp. INR15]|uniref:hypothetical protein n=1 Tax=Mesorhizobium sp. INR15 TaxID=2654248 RepID=UPI0018969384|nr:hypothetical protein [Mesorhizobium sp. INR15]QPC91580.1 hypothetical protein GA829_13735 [Mesorhizobium sp. INR15]
MVKNVDQALQDAILAIRMLRKSIVDHGHLGAMIGLDRTMESALAEAERAALELQQKKPT